MESPFVWLAASVLLVVILAMGRYLVPAVGKQMARDIAGYLRPEIEAMSREAVSELIDAAVAPFALELTENGGSTLWDAIHRIDREVHRLGLAEGALSYVVGGWEPPWGIELRIERTAGNVIEAAADGTLLGLRLFLNVIAMLIAFMGLVALVNWPLGALGEALALEGGLSLARILGWLFAPVAWVMGVDGWHDMQLFGSLLGTKLTVSEFVAFTEMKAIVTGVRGVTFEHERTAKMAAYALCGFANLASIGVQIGGITPMAPERKGDLARLALRAMIGGAFASWMTATIAGAFL